MHPWLLHRVLTRPAESLPRADAIVSRAGSGILVLLGATTCAALISSVTRLFHQIQTLLWELLRLFILTIIAALVVFAVVALTFADLLRR